MRGSGGDLGGFEEFINRRFELIGKAAAVQIIKPRPSTRV